MAALGAVRNHPRPSGRRKVLFLTSPSLFPRAAKWANHRDTGHSMGPCAGGRLRLATRGDAVRLIISASGARNAQDLGGNLWQSRNSKHSTTTAADVREKLKSPPPSLAGRSAT